MGGYLRTAFRIQTVKACLKHPRVQTAVCELCLTALLSLVIVLKIFMEKVRKISTEVDIWLVGQRYWGPWKESSLATWGGSPSGQGIYGAALPPRAVYFHHSKELSFTITVVVVVEVPLKSE